MSPLKFRMFLLFKLPIAFIAGVKLKHIDEQTTQIKVKFGWLNQNPFRSMFWAVEGMAAELSTGLPAVLEVQRQQPKGVKVSMLLVGLKSEFGKKAVGTIVFTCEQNQQIREIIQKSIDSGEPQTINLLANGVDEEGDTVAQFDFFWSYKASKKNKDSIQHED